MGRNRNKNVAKHGYKNQAEEKAVRLHMELGKYEEFKTMILPELQRALKDKVDITSMLKSYAPMAVARAITIMMTETDTTKALVAIKDILDRSQGKPTEHKKIQHTIAEMTEEELNAALQSKFLGADEESDSTEH